MCYASSIASVALEAWSLLGREDDELRRHLEVRDCIKNVFDIRV